MSRNRKIKEEKRNETNDYGKQLNRKTKNLWKFKEPVKQRNKKVVVKLRTAKTKMRISSKESPGKIETVKVQKQ